MSIASNETAWESVNEHLPDPTFGGLDRNTIRDRYHDLVADVMGDADFITLASRLLGGRDSPRHDVFNLKKDAGLALVSWTSGRHNAHVSLMLRRQAPRRRLRGAGTGRGSARQAAQGRAPRCIRCGASGLGRLSESRRTDSAQGATCTGAQQAGES